MFVRRRTLRCTCLTGGLCLDISAYIVLFRAYFLSFSVESFPHPESATFTHADYHSVPSSQMWFSQHRWPGDRLAA